MWREKARAAIYEIAGVFLLMEAWNLFRNRAQSIGGEYMLVLFFCLVFLVCGAGLIGFGLYIIYGKFKASATKETESNRSEK